LRSGSTLTTDIVRTFSWLFLLLMTLAMLSQPGSSQDEWLHASRIWCGQGEQHPFCSTDGRRTGEIRVIRVGLDGTCTWPPDMPFLCPALQRASNSDLVAEVKHEVSRGIEPEKLFYRVFSWISGPSLEISVLFARVVNGLALTLVLGTGMWLLPSRHRLILAVTMIATFSGASYFLMASINPVSWAIAGVVTGFLALQAAIMSRDLSDGRVLSLAVLGAFSIVLAVGSGRHVLPLFPVSLVLLVANVIWLKLHNWRNFVLGATAVMIIGWLVNAHFNYRTSLSSLFFALPRVLKVVGTVPTTGNVRLPLIVYIASVVLIGTLLIVTYERQNKLQILGTFMSLVVAGIFVMRTSSNEVASRSLFDAQGVPQTSSDQMYVFLVFIFSWWLLNTDDGTLLRLVTYLKHMSVVAIGVYSLTTFTIAERFIDHQTFGLRLLPDGPDQWWWNGFDVAPNVVFVATLICLWRFLRGLCAVVGDSSLAVSRI